MSTEVAILSNALVMLGDAPIASLTENTVRAQAAANLYPATRDSVLRSHPWNCATKRVALAPDSTAPAFDWAFMFAMPGDCLRVLGNGQDGYQDDYRVEGRWILADENPLYLRYIYRNDNVATWDASLIDAVTVAMAARLAMPRTGSEGKKQEFERQLQQLLRTARVVDGQENPPEDLGRPYFRALRS